jgi:hypothetical protein
VTGLSLSRLLRDHPDIKLEKVEYFTNLRSARGEGVTSIPTLKSGDKQLSGFLLSKSRMREFLASL